MSKTQKIELRDRITVEFASTDGDLSLVASTNGVQGEGQPAPRFARIQKRGLARG